MSRIPSKPDCCAKKRSCCDIQDASGATAGPSTRPSGLRTPMTEAQKRTMMTAGLASGRVTPSQFMRSQLPPSRLTPAGASRPPGTPGGRPAIGRPGFATPSIGRPGISTPTIGRPGFATPATGRPGMSTPGIGRPGMSASGIGRPGFATPSIGRPGISTPSIGRPGFATPSIGRPGISTPGIGRPGISSPGIGRPRIPRPGIARPGPETGAIPKVPKPIAPGKSEFRRSKGPGASSSKPAPAKHASRLQRFDKSISAELSRKKAPPSTSTTTTSDVNLLEAADKLARAELADNFAGAIAAAEAAAATTEDPRRAEEAAAEGVRTFQSEIVDVVREDIPGEKSIQVLGYIGMTRPKYAAR